MCQTAFDNSFKRYDVWGKGGSYGTAKSLCLEALYFKEKIDRFERSLISAQLYIEVI